jgi:hypothetical protein
MGLEWLLILAMLLPVARGHWDDSLWRRILTDRARPNRLHSPMTQWVRSRIGSVFIGREGLRAGWRFLLFALGILLGVRFVEDPLSHFLAQRLAINLNELSASALLIRKFVLCVSVFLVTAIAATVERQRENAFRLPNLGQPRRRATRRL